MGASQSDIMIHVRELRKIAKAYLKDSEILFQNVRYDRSIYLCGYAVEIALKLKICKTLGWDGFPESNSEFTNYSSFKTHDLDVLLHLSGKEEGIKSSYLADWSMIAQWDPQVRYKALVRVRKRDAQQMISSSKRILNVLGTKV